MQCRDQHPASNPDAFIDIIVLGFAIFRNAALALCKNNDEVRRSLQKRLVRIGSNRRESIKPFLARFRLALIHSIKAAFLFFGGLADSGFLFR